MTNREKLLHLSLRDLIMSIECAGYRSIDGIPHFCRLSMLSLESTKGPCDRHKGNCVNCIDEWLDSEEEQNEKSI